MKRSEMIKIIKHILTVPRIDYCERDPNEHWEMIASEVMAAIEYHGMVPPIIEKESWLISHPETGEMTYAVHRWEPEDETK